MRTYLQAYFDKLKLHVLSKAQLSKISPADCYRLALEIKDKTNKSVSETTIKRVFGFASSIHHPSIYTLNALAEYSDFDGWDHFYMQMEQYHLHTSQQKAWCEIALNATKISLFNIQSNKYKCGIPYHQTIDRKCVHDFVEHFLESDATIGVLSGSAGCGKTVAISRWVEARISEIHDDPNHDIYFFTNSLSLLQGAAFGYHINKWLAHLLGFETTELLDGFMDNNRENPPGNFYLVIDELHSELVADRQLYTVISQVIEMVSHFAQYNWFRVILVLRTITFLKYESLFKSTVINPQWFSVLSGETGKQWANMGPFSNLELLSLARNVNEKVNPYQLRSRNRTTLINTPQFFQHYYELYGEKLDPSQVSQFDEYLVITRYLKKKVFNGINTMAKQALMEELAELIEEHNGTLQITKKQAYAIIRQYRTAYNDLLYIGMLYENNDGLELRQHTVIQFQFDVVAAYFIALRLFNSHQEAPPIINALEQLPLCPQTKVMLLKWLLLFDIESGNLSLVNVFGKIPYIQEEPYTIIPFVCDGLHKLSQRAAPSIKAEINLKLKDGGFMKYVHNNICFQVEYEPGLENLLDFDLSDTNEIILRSKLALVALLKWDEDALHFQLDKLSTLRPEAYVGFIANPYNMLSYLYQYFKGQAADHMLAHELESLPIRFQLTNQPVTNQLFDILIYMLVRVLDNVEIARWYSAVLKQRIADINPANTFELDSTSIIYALYLLECGDIDTALQYATYRSPHSLNNMTYSLLHAIFHILLGKFKDAKHDEITHRAIAACDAYGFKLLGAYCRVLALRGMPRDERLRNINELKFQSLAFGYVIGVEALSKKYG
ncbi:hypothetical protein [Parapedobacter sp. DT-150]|uniref:hypothetical protein n=1 Tax=Parapedobacter sp. DT-150 TaxID=3396162 RepID=UPI003F1A7436